MQQISLCVQLECFVYAILENNYFKNDLPIAAMSLYIPVHLQDNLVVQNQMRMVLINHKWKLQLLVSCYSQPGSSEYADNRQ